MVGAPAGRISRPASRSGADDRLQRRGQLRRAARLVEVIEVDQHRGRPPVVADEQAGQERVRLDALLERRDLGVVRRHLGRQRRDLQRVVGAVDVLDPRRHQRQHAARLHARDLLERLRDALDLAQIGRRVDGAGLGVEADHRHVFAAEQLLDALADDHQRVPGRNLLIDVQQHAQPADEEAEHQGDQHDRGDHELRPADDGGDVAAQHVQRCSNSDLSSGSRNSLPVAK